MADQAWAQVARDSREALRWLGYPIETKCLPDETEPCGASFSQHAAAHFATIKAICDHQLTHLGPPAGFIATIYRHQLAELERGDADGR